MNFHTKPNRYVSHVNMKVQNMERSLKFYQNVIGFQILQQVGNKVSLTADGKTSFLTIEQPENVTPKPERATGIYHFALLFSKRSDLANMIFQLVRHNIEIGAGDHRVSEAIYIADPDGNEIEIAYDNDPADWKWDQGEVELAVDPLNFEEILAEGNQQAPWKALPTDTVLGHIHLYISDLEESEKFYTEGLGYDVVGRYGKQALFISTGQYHHHIALNTWMGVGAPTPAEHSVGMKSYTIVLEDAETRKTIINQLEKVGATVIKKNGTFVTHDPSMNKIILAI